MRQFIIALVLAGTCAAAGAAQVPDDTASAVAGRFMERLRAADFAAAAAMVAPSVRDRLGEEQLAAVWAQVKEGLGDLTATRPRGVTATDSLKAVELYGDFTAQTLLLRVVVTPQKEIVGFWLGPVPPDAPSAPAGPPYADASRFRESEVEVGSEPWKLPGTLTVPVGAGPFPAVVLVHGSGPHDRDETVGGTRVFRDLAHGLASRGIVVLRYEKRTKEHGARMTGAVTVDEETIDDAVAGLNLLRGHASVDGARIYVLGHSLGAQLAPAIVERSGGVAAGAVLLAAPGRPTSQLIRDQLEYLKTLPENAPADRQAMFAGMLGELDRFEAGAAGAGATLLGAPVAYFRDLEKHDAVAAAAKMDRPLLVLQGERDYQVTMDDFGIWRERLGSRPTVTLRSFPALNHLFVAGSGQPTPSEYAAEGHVAEEVVTTIAAWIGKRSD